MNRRQFVINATRSAGAMMFLPLANTPVTPTTPSPDVVAPVIRSIDIVAHSFGMHRKPGETDPELRERVTNTPWPVMPRTGDMRSEVFHVKQSTESR